MGHAATIQWAETDDNRFAIEFVVDNLMPVENLNGVGFDDAVVGDTQDCIARLEVIRLIGRNELGMIDCGNAVPRGAATKNFILWNQRLIEIENAAPGNQSLRLFA